VNDAQFIWQLNHVKSVISRFSSFPHIFLLFILLLYTDMSEG